MDRPSTAGAGGATREEAAEPAEPAPPGTALEALALSVGHDINNPLAALLTNLDMAVDLLRDERLEPQERTTEALPLLGNVRQAAERIRAVVQHLRVTTLATQTSLLGPAAAFPAVDPVTDASRHKVRVLVVDDDVAVGNGLRRSLSEYDVVLLDNAKEALLRLEAGERFDVILCDLMMPGMTGMDLHERLLRVVPDQAESIVFMTGAAVTTQARDFVAAVRNPVLNKPFDVKALREMIRARTGITER